MVDTISKALRAHTIVIDGIAHEVEASVYEEEEKVIYCTKYDKYMGHEYIFDLTDSYDLEKLEKATFYELVEIN